jgi:hypothetical protein
MLKSIQYDVNDIMSIWQIIIWRMNEYKVGPRKLAELTGYSIAIILKGVYGEPALITDDFLRKCVRAFRLTNGRIDPKNPTDINNILTREECISILRPPPAMPPYGKNFWEK